MPLNIGQRFSNLLTCRVGIPIKHCQPSRHQVVSLKHLLWAPVAQLLYGGTCLQPVACSTCLPQSPAVLAPDMLQGSCNWWHACCISSMSNHTCIHHVPSFDALHLQLTSMVALRVHSLCWVSAFFARHALHRTSCQFVYTPLVEAHGK